ncbi:MAG: 16S rRNA (uracil(1498)-N(3))-methyltransferase [Clostridia bacterium]|jgi:16S rRNA (uracil1498-N3)-methyltransferase|nr:16S rRNA (uracil(1498)-N(3))-methyltransferase [Clostridia bacterium]
MYKFFVIQDQVKENYIEILEEDANHIGKVLRLKIGETIEICNVNDLKNNYICSIINIENKKVEAKIIEKIKKHIELPVYVHIFQGLPKAEKLELIIQKTTELGVAEITPVIMKRSIVKLNEKTEEKKINRWRRISESAAKQSKQNRVPIINFPIELKQINEKIKDYDLVILAYEKEEDTYIKDILKQVTIRNNIKVAVIIGPEGGIDTEELEELQKSQVKTVTLGKRILRTETAPIAIISIIMYEFDAMKQ